jgi:hypothetical protein
MRDEYFDSLVKTIEDVIFDGKPLPVELVERLNRVDNLVARLNGGVGRLRSTQIISVLLEQFYQDVEHEVKCHLKVWQNLISKN